MTPRAGASLSTTCDCICWHRIFGCAVHSTAFLRARQLAMAKTRFDDELCTAGPPRTARTKSKALLYKYALMSAVMSAG
eukprot:scaffold97019_cov19-Tisochrysis_lutea.AAC.3